MILVSHCILHFCCYRGDFTHSRCIARGCGWSGILWPQPPQTRTIHIVVFTWKARVCRGLFMWGVLRTSSLILGMAALAGCHHDKYNMRPEPVEEYYLPPDEPRYNLPDVAPYKKPPQQKEDKSLLSKPGPGGGPGGMGGF